MKIPGMDRLRITKAGKMDIGPPRLALKDGQSCSIPINWLKTASRHSGKALAVASVIWTAAQIEGSHAIELRRGGLGESASRDRPSTERLPSWSKPV